MALLQSLFGLATGGESLPMPQAQPASTYWGRDPAWLKLSPTERAAAMALLEADTKNGKIDLGSARNALGAMINRADKEGVDLGEHVSGKIYQPTIEPAQRARLDKIVGSPEHQEMVALANRRLSGDEGDWVSGATHFLAPEKTMLALEAQNPSKYKNWGPRGQNWTGYDPNTGEYKGVVMRDASHAFLAPGGAHSAQFGVRSPYEGIDSGGASPAVSPVAVAAAQASGGARPSAGTMAPQTSGSSPNAAPAVNEDQAVLDLVRQAQKAKEQDGLAASAMQQSQSGGGQIRYAQPQAPDIRKMLALLKNRQQLGSTRRA